MGTGNIQAIPTSTYRNCYKIPSGKIEKGKGEKGKKNNPTHFKICQMICWKRKKKETQINKEKKLPCNVLKAFVEVIFFFFFACWRD